MLASSYLVLAKMQLLFCLYNAFVSFLFAFGEYQHTLTAWKTRDDMMNYIHDKYHSRAMKQFSSIGSGSTYGFEAEEIPSWESALKIWKENFNLQK